MKKHTKIFLTCLFLCCLCWPFRAFSQANFRNVYEQTQLMQLTQNLQLLISQIQSEYGSIGNYDNLDVTLNPYYEEINRMLGIVSPGASLTVEGEEAHFFLDFKNLSFTTCSALAKIDFGPKTFFDDYKTGTFSAQSFCRKEPKLVTLTF
jgi:hypothetical protein